MPYAVRNDEGAIVSLHRHDPGVGEFLGDDHVDVRAFVGLDGGDREGFGRLDAEFVRVIEDVIDALAERNVINLSDLPSTVQVKLFARKSFRDRRAHRALQLFEPADALDGVI